MNLIDRVKSHYENLDKREINIPEWDLKAYSRPLTLADRAKIDKIAKNLKKDGGAVQDDDYSFNVDTVIIKLEDASGKRIFSIADRPDLLESADARVVARVASEIFSSSGTIEEEKKDSLTDGMSSQSID